MAAPTPPRTPAPRKSVPGSPSVARPNVTALGSPISIQKRKWQGDNVSLPLQGLTQPESEGESAPVAQMVSAKKQRQQHLTMPASPLRNQDFAQNPSGLPMRPPQPHPPNNGNTPNDWPMTVFLAALRSNRTLLPANPLNNPVNSQRIDDIAHAMWQVVFKHENMMKDVTAKVAMFSQLKLRTLAKLNYLPSWWFLREMACGVMKRQGWHMNDNEMQILWNETVEWCKKVEIKLGVQGDSAVALKQESRNAVQEGVMKEES